MICDKIDTSLIELSKKKETLVDKKRGSGRSKFLIENKQEKTFFKIDFENAVYKGNAVDSKCDFGIKLDLENNKSILYFELKGSDVDGGVKQLLETIKDTEKCFEGYVKKARLVVSKYSKPDLVRRTPHYKDLIRITSNNLKIKQNLIVENI